MKLSEETLVEARNQLHSAIRAAAYLNKHSHALEDSILRRRIVHVSEERQAYDTVSYCSSCDARTVDKCLQLLTRLSSSELHVVVKKTAEVLIKDSSKAVAAAPAVKSGFKPSLECKRRPLMTNFSYAKMKKVVKDEMLQKQKTGETTLREAAFFNPKRALGDASKTNEQPQKRENDKSGHSVVCTVKSTNQDGRSDSSTVTSNNQEEVAIAQHHRQQTQWDFPLPHVKLDHDGKIILDPQYLSVHLPRQDKDVNQHRTTVKWPFKDTVKFYEALHRHGTDFSMMMSDFKSRTRSNLKSKFVSEDKKNRKLVDMVIRNGSTLSDLQGVIRQLQVQNDLKLIARANKL